MLLLLRQAWTTHFSPGAALFLPFVLCVVLASVAIYLSHFFLCYLALAAISGPLVAQFYFQIDFMVNTLRTSLLPLDSLYRQDGWRFFVAECCQGCLVGFVGVQRTSPDAAELVHLFVDPSFRQCGLGRRLCMEVESFCRSQSYKAVSLLSLDVFHAACRLYERIGYKRKKQFAFRQAGPFRFYGVICYQLTL